MNTNDAALETQADLLVEAALRELGDTPFDEPDEYADQCHNADCYVWLESVIRTHPHDRPVDPLAYDDTNVLNVDIYG